MITRGFAKSLLGKLARFFAKWVVVGVMVVVLVVSWKKMEAPTSLLTPLASETLVSPYGDATRGRSSTATPGTGSGLTSTEGPTRTVEPTEVVLAVNSPTVEKETVTATQYPTNTQYPTFTPIHGDRSAEWSQGRLPSATPKPPTATLHPSPTENYGTVLQITLEAAKDEREHKAQIWGVQRQLLWWCGLAGIVPLFIVLMAGAILIVLHVRNEIEDLSYEPALRPAQGTDGPGVAVGEVGESDLVQIEVKHGSTTYRYPWPVERRVLRQWSQVALTGGRLGINAWTGEGKPFVRDGDGNYGEFLAFWIKAGVLTRSNPNEPHSRILVTDVGEPVLKVYANGQF